MQAGNSEYTQSGQASVSDMTDEDLVINYCLQNKVSKPVIGELLKRGYTSLEALRLVDIEDLDCPKIPKGQRRLIIHIASVLKVGTATDQTTCATDGTAATTSSEAADIIRMEPSAMTSSEAPGLTSSTDNTTGLRQNSLIEQTDLYDRFVQQQQQAFSANGVVGTTEAGPGPLPQVSWSDPQIHLSSAAGKSAFNYYDICDFVQTTVEEEVVLGGQGDQQIVVKSGPKKPRLENLTLSQWSVANLAILYKLVSEQKLLGSSLMDYLSYSTKIYQLVQRYSLVSVLLFDREYRKLQSSMKFRWGTDVQHLSNIHLQPRDRPVAQGSQQKRNSVQGRQNGKPSKGKNDPPICRNFNSQKGCSLSDCKYRHACILPGCNQAHSALNHTAGKN